MGDLMGICQDDIKKAYKNGCDEVKKTLGDLFPSLKLGGGEYHDPETLTVEIDRNSFGCYFMVKRPGGGSVASDIKCYEDGVYTWVPFLNCQMVVTKYRNFEILKR